MCSRGSGSDGSWQEMAAATCIMHRMATVNPDVRQSWESLTGECFQRKTVRQRHLSADTDHQPSGSEQTD